MIDVIVIYLFPTEIRQEMRPDMRPRPQDPHRPPQHAMPPHGGPPHGGPPHGGPPHGGPPHGGPSGPPHNRMMPNFPGDHGAGRGPRPSGPPPTGPMAAPGGEADKEKVCWSRLPTLL